MVTIAVTVNRNPNWLGRRIGIEFVLVRIFGFFRVSVRQGGIGGAQHAFASPYRVGFGIILCHFYRIAPLCGGGDLFNWLAHGGVASSTHSLDCYGIGIVFQ